MTDVKYTIDDIEMELTKGKYHNLVDGKCSDLTECDGEPTVGKDQTETDAVGIIERVRINQHGPGRLGDDYWGEIYIRVSQKWYVFSFSV